MITSRQLAVSLFEATVRSPEKSEAVFASFMEFCTENNVTHLLPRVVVHLERLQRERVEQDTLRISVARDHDTSVVDMIRDHVAGSSQDTPTTTNVDETLVGGFVGLYRNTIYDGSVKSQLAKVQRKMING